MSQIALHHPSERASAAVPASQSSRPWLPSLAGGVVGLLWLAIAWILHDEHYGFEAVFVSALMVGTAIAMYAWRPARHFEDVRFIGLIMFVQMFLNAGMSVIRDPGQLRFAPSPGAFSFAVEAAFTLATMFTASVGGMLYLFRRQLSDTAPVGVGKGAAVLLATGAAGASIASVKAASLGQVGTLPGVLFSLSLIVPLLVATRLLCKKPLWLPLGICFLGQGVLLFYTSSVGTVGLVVQYLLLTYVYLRRPIPWAMVLGIIALVIVVNPAKHAFRQVLSRESSELTTASAFGSGERALEVWGDSLQSTWGAGSDRQQVDENLSSTSSRFDYNWVSALVYSAVPGALPHESGATYGDIPLIVIPRIIYPDKPMSNDYFKTRWTVKLGIQSWGSARSTAVAIPTAAEAYWNFGWIGVALVPLVLGVLFGAVLLLAPREPVGRAAYTVLVSTISLAFLDMVVWLIPSLLAFIASAVLVRLYTWNFTGR